MYIQTQTTFKDYFRTVTTDLFYMAATHHLQMCVHMHFTCVIFAFSSCCTLNCELILISFAGFLLHITRIMV